VPRRAREESPSGLYHVTSRGTGGLVIYRDDADRIAFLAFLARIGVAEDWLVHAYCLMGTHFHIVLAAELERLSKGMQRLKGRYGQYLNGRYDRQGHVFEARFHSRPILDDAHALLATAYLAVNPVAAGICETADGWRWSSHRAHVGLDRPPDFLADLESFGVFDGGMRPAVEVYRSLVSEKEREVRLLQDARRGRTPSASVPYRDGD
jgi:putative transposase